MITAQTIFMKSMLIPLFTIFGFITAAQNVKVVNLRCEYKVNPLGIEAPRPKLSWELQSTQKNCKQTAFQVLVSDEATLLNKNIGNIWDSKIIKSMASIQLPYNGERLLPAKKYYWKVKIWDNKNQVSSFSDMAFWQMGLPKSTDWLGAQWIAYDELPDSNRIVPFAHGDGKKEWGKRPDVLPLLRKSISLSKNVKTATIFICGLGQFELSINGKKIGDHFLDPGWTQFSKHAEYLTFDITDDLLMGENTLGVMLGNGFYYIPGERYRKLTGAYGYPKMRAIVVLEYKDGSKQHIVSDGTWKTSPSAIYFSSIYGGEDYDANLVQPGWNEKAFDDSGWKNAVITGGPPVLNAQIAEPLKVYDHLESVNKKEVKPGIWVYDLGQNFSGIPLLEVSGKKGDTVKMTTAELIMEDGTANQKASGGPHGYTYILKGDGVEKWQPRFTYYGFRYIQVEGALPEGVGNAAKLPSIISLKGLHIRNSAAEIGKFNSSNELFNKTNNLIKWAIRSNMMSVFTDCPHREKLGWLEETHLMGSSVQYNYDVSGLCKKAILDMIHAQTNDGLVPDIAPEFVQFDGGFRDSPEWGSAAIILPWYAYQWYGDKETLTMAYDMMKKYAAYLQKKSVDNILSHGLGDWYDIGPNPPGVSQLTPLGVTATATYYYDLSILQQTASLLGKTSDAQLFKQQAAAVKKAFNNKFFNPGTKQYATGSQASNAMALYMDLVEPQHREAVLANLIKDIRSRNNALTAGDVGYRYVLRALENAGRSDVIFDMNSRNDVPGYGYQLKHGATALTESWQAYPSVSNNHFMLGHLMEWFYSGLAGITQEAGSVGFKRIVIRPQPVGDVKQAKASFHSVHGLISVEWEKENDIMKLSVAIPANTAATIYFPAEYNKAPAKVGSGLYSYILKSTK